MRTRFGLLQMFLLVALVAMVMALFTELNRRWGLLFSDHVPLALSSDGRFVAAGVSSLPIQIWDTQNNQRVALLSGHDWYVQGIAFTDNRQLVSGSWDGSIRYWDAATQQELRRIDAGQELIQSLEVSHDKRLIATGGEDATVKLWDQHSGEEIATLTGHTSAVCRLSFSPDGRWLGSIGEDGAIRVWEITTQQLVFSQPKHNRRCVYPGIAISPDGALAVACHRHAKLELFDLPSGELLGELHGPEGNNYSSVAFSPDGSTVALGHFGLISLHDVKSKKRIRIIETDVGWVDSLAFSMDGSTLFSGCYHNRVLKWDVATGRQLAVLQRDWDGFQWDLFAIGIVSAAVWLAAWQLAAQRRRKVEILTANSDDMAT